MISTIALSWIASWALFAAPPEYSGPGSAYPEIRRQELEKFYADVLPCVQALSTIYSPQEKLGNYIGYDPENPVRLSVAFTAESAIYDVKYYPNGTYDFVRDPMESFVHGHVLPDSLEDIVRGRITLALDGLSPNYSARSNRSRSRIPAAPYNAALAACRSFYTKDFGDVALEFSNAQARANADGTVADDVGRPGKQVDADSQAPGPMKRDSSKRGTGE